MSVTVIDWWLSHPTKFQQCPLTLPSHHDHLGLPILLPQSTKSSMSGGDGLSGGLASTAIPANIWKASWRDLQEAQDKEERSVWWSEEQTSQFFLMLSLNSLALSHYECVSGLVVMKAPLLSWSRDHDILSCELPMDELRKEEFSPFVHVDRQYIDIVLHPLFCMPNGSCSSQK